MGRFFDLLQLPQQQDPVAVWNGIRVVVDFRRRRDNSTENPPHFGFDWIDVDDKGEITKHHNINYGNISHVLVKDRAKITDSCYLKNDNNRDVIQKYIETRFPIYSIICQDNKKRLYTSKSWVSFPDFNSDIELRMIIREDNTNRQNRFPARIYFDIPEGISLRVGNDTYDHDSRDTPYEVNDNSDILINITNTNPENVGKDLSIKIWENKRENTVALATPIGEIGLVINDLKEYPVFVWPLIKAKGGNLSQVTLTTSQISALRTKLTQNFNQAGINIDLQIDDSQSTQRHITYDKDSDEIKDCFKTGSVDMFEQNGAYDFANKVSDKFTGLSTTDSVDFLTRVNADFPENFKGTHLLLVETPTYVNPKAASNNNTPTMGNAGYTYYQGLAPLGGDICLIFSNILSEYGVYSHELGHTLDCSHTFDDYTKPFFHDRLIDTVIELNKIEREITDQEINNYNNAGSDSSVYGLSNQDVLNEYGTIQGRAEERQAKIDGNQELTKQEKKQEEEDKIRKEQILVDFHQWMIDTSRLNNHFEENLEYGRLIEYYESRIELMPLILYKEKKTTGVAIMDYDTSYTDFFQWEWIILKNKCNARVHNE